MVPLNLAKRLSEMGYILAPAKKPIGAYVPVMRNGNLVFTSGQTAKRQGEPFLQGQLGAEISVEQGREEARRCVVNCLALLHECAGGLDNINQVIKLTGFVNSAPGFTDQPKVIDGASELLVELLGENGRHARTVVGVSALPGGAVCEIEMIVRVIQ